jgi:hypothetical protein
MSQHDLDVLHNRFYLTACSAFHQMPMETSKSSAVFLRCRGRVARLALAWGVTALASGCVTDARRDGLSPYEFDRVDRIAMHLGSE